MVAMSGWIMPEPLAMPAMVTSVAPMRCGRNAALGEGVGGADRLRGVAPGVRARAPSCRPGSAAAILATGKRLADHAGRGDVDSPRAARRAGRRPPPPRPRTAASPAGADHHVGVAGIDHQRRAPGRAAGSRGTSAPDGPGTLERVSRPATVVPGGELDQQQIGPPAIAQPGGARGEAHPGDRRHVGKAARARAASAAAASAGATARGPAYSARLAWLAARLPRRCAVGRLGRPRARSASASRRVEALDLGVVAQIGDQRGHDLARQLLAQLRLASRRRSARRCGGRAPR